MANKRKWSQFAFDDDGKEKKRKPEERKKAIDWMFRIPPDKMPLLYNNFNSEAVFDEQRLQCPRSVRYNAADINLFETACGTLQFSWTTKRHGTFSFARPLEQLCASNDWEPIAAALGVPQDFGPFKIIDEFCEWFTIDLSELWFVLRYFLCEHRFGPNKEEEGGRRTTLFHRLSLRDPQAFFRVQFDEVVEDWNAGVLDIRVGFDMSE